MSNYAEFMMRLQETFLNKFLPETKEDVSKFRKHTVNSLSDVVSKLVVHLAPGTVLEIGAHGAEFSQSMKAALPGSRIVAIEANPTVFQKYQQTLEGSGVEYIHKCIADESRQYAFRVPISEDDQEKVTMGSLLSYQSAAKFTEFHVEGQRLDDFLQGDQSRLALWIDVEGAIGSVLSGASDALKRCDLLFVELEANRRWDGQLLDHEVIAILAEYGLVPILRDIQRSKWQHNICFVRADRLSDPKVLELSRSYVGKVARAVKPPKKAKPAPAAVVDCVGIVRFSVLSTVYNKFQAWEGQTFESYAKIILDDARLASRFDLFQNITLPSFDAQTDKNFVLLVVAPRLLPEKWRKKLHDLTNGRDYMRIHYADETDFRMSSLSPMIVKDLVPQAEIFSTFRIDDDDAVKDNFIKRLRRYHKPGFVSHGVSHTSGYYLDISPDAPKVALNAKQRVNNSVGLAFIGSREKPNCLFDYSDGHKNYHYAKPVIIDGRESAFLLVNHDYNDTKELRHADDYPLNITKAAATLVAEGFHINLAELMIARNNGRSR